jgi:hypothetical protein
MRFLPKGRAMAMSARFEDTSLADFRAQIELIYSESSSSRRPPAYNFSCHPGCRRSLRSLGFRSAHESVGAVAISGSTIIVAANAQLLRRLKLQRAVL